MNCVSFDQRNCYAEDFFAIHNNIFLIAFKHRENKSKQSIVMRYNVQANTYAVTLEEINIAENYHSKEICDLRKQIKNKSHLKILDAAINIAKNTNTKKEIVATNHLIQIFMDDIYSRLGKNFSQKNMKLKEKENYNKLFNYLLKNGSIII